MEIENSQKLFSVFITHNSKIRELSDENRVMETELLFVKQPFCYGPTIFKLWVMKFANPNSPYKSSIYKFASTYKC